MVLDEKVEVVKTSPAQSIDELVLPLVTAAGLELWDVVVNPRMVRVLVDRRGGIDLTSLTDLARAVSDALDDRDDLTPAGLYELEVSSPGVERTLRTRSHFQRFVGTTVAVKTTVAIGGSRRLQGVLLGADDAGVTINLDEGSLGEGSLGEGATRVGYEQIQKAHTVLVWGPSPKPSAAKKAGPKATTRYAGPRPTSAERSESMKGSAR